MKKTAGRTFCIVHSAFCIVGALSAHAADKWWNTEVSSGLFTDGANWRGGIAPAAGDTAWVSNSEATVTFPAGTTTHEGLLYLMAPSPNDEQGKVVLDTTGATVNIGPSGQNSIHREIVKGWSFANGIWNPNATLVESFRISTGANYALTDKHFTLDGAVMRVANGAGGTTVSIEGGTTTFHRRLLVRGTAGNGVTNWTTLVLSGGSVASSDSHKMGGIDLVAYSKLRLGAGSYNFRIAANAGGSPWKAEDAPYFPVGPSEVEFLDGATNNVATLWSGLGSALGERDNGQGAMTMHGHSLYKAVQASSSSGADFIVAKGANSVGSLTMLDSASMLLQGTYGGYGGHLYIAKGTNSKGEVHLRDKAKIETRWNVTLGATGSTALLEASDASSVTVESGSGVIVGAAGTTDAVVSIAGNASVSAGKVLTQAKATDEGFVRAEVRLLGGTLTTSCIEGSNTLSFVCGGGTLKAKAASTAVDPFVHGVASFTATGGTAPTIVIDTQGYNTYVSQDFGVGATVLKRGSGTLHVLADSSHARTLVEAGSVVLENGATQFGTILSPRTMIWAGADGGAWATAGNWTVGGAVATCEPTAIDTATVNGEATIALPSMAAAKSLTLADDGVVSLTGDGSLSLGQTLVIAPETSPKIVENAGSVAISTPAVSASGVTLQKQGAGELALAFTATGDKVLGVDVREGAVRLAGDASTSGAISVGNASNAAATPVAELLLDNFSSRGGLYLGGGNADVARLILTNGASVVLPGGKSAYLGPNAATQKRNVIVVCQGSSIRSGGSAQWTGRIILGPGLDMLLEGALRAENGETSDYGWIRSVLSAANSTVTVANGGCVSFHAGLCCKNSTVSVTDANKFTMVFNGGSLIPTVPAGVGSRYCVMWAPQYQGFVAASGGMNVDMANCPRYVICCPIRGDGALIKTGSGTLVMGTGRNFNYNGSGIYTDNDVTNTTKFVASGIVTVQNAGGVFVNEGAVEIEADATDANSRFTIAADASLDLAGNTVAVGSVGGGGTVSNGGFAAIPFRAVTTPEAAPIFQNVAFPAKPPVDFDCDTLHPADSGFTYCVGRLGTGTTGLSIGESRIVHAVNSGDPERRYARIEVRADGTVTARLTAGCGTTLLVR